MDYSERMMRAMLSDLPDGDGTFEDFLDGDGIDDAPIWIRMQISKRGDRIRVSFDGTDPQVKGPINAPLSVTASGVYCGLKTSIDPNSLIPPNSGCWRAIEVTAPEGSVLNCEFPCPVVYANHEISHRLADMVMGALSHFLPGQVMACSQGTSCILTLGGTDPRTGNRYVSYETIKGGFGARPNKDGINTICAGISNTMNTPIEVLEMAFPIRLLEYSIEPDSGGPGQHRGGNGSRRIWQMLDGADATGSLCVERMKSPPFGLLGGKPGVAATVTLTTPEGETIDLAGKGAFSAPAGSVINMRTTGSGGMGDPSLRSGEAVLADLADGYVTPEHAQREYGVDDSQT